MPTSPGRDQGLHERTREVWQKRYSRLLTDEDCREIESNVTAFFRLLMRWDAEARAGKSNPVSRLLESGGSVTRSDGNNPGQA